MFELIVGPSRVSSGSGLESYTELLDVSLSCFGRSLSPNLFGHS